MVSHIRIGREGYGISLCGEMVFVVQAASGEPPDLSSGKKPCRESSITCTSSRQLDLELFTNPWSTAMKRGEMLRCNKLKAF